MLAIALHNKGKHNVTKTIAGRRLFTCHGDFIIKNCRGRAWKDPQVKLLSSLTSFGPFDTQVIHVFP